MELQICDDTIIKSSPDYAHILSIVFNDPDAYKWFAESYIQLLIGTDGLDREPMFYNFVDYSMFSNTDYYFVANNKTCPFADIYRDPYNIVEERGISIIDYIKEKLQNNFYIMFFVDITEIAAYKLHIKFHCPLIYGYDDEKQEILFRDYCGLHYIKSRMSFDELEKGFIKFREQKNIYQPFIEYGINCIQLKHIDYYIDSKKIIGSLRDYLFGDEVKETYFKFLQNSSYHYGIDVLRLTKKALLKEIEKDKLNIGWRVRYAHFIDFEQAMVSRIEILHKNQMISSKESNEMILLVKSNLDCAEKVLNCYLKFLIKPNRNIILNIISSER